MASNTLVSDRKGHDIREDEEQGVKLQEIVELLVAAGYFRARIKGLSPFDKVVGGMTWCMESCYYDVDVDLLFQENSTIGQKIALTEKIVTVLPRMGCPHRLEPHQIQGLDFIHIFPVIQWLVKESVAVREDKREFLRNSAIRNFECRFRPDDGQKANSIKCIYKLQETYRPQRIYRRKHGIAGSDEDSVESTLMEYGISSLEGGEPTASSVTQINDMKTLEYEQPVISHGTVNRIVSAQGEAIAAISEQFGNVDLEDDPLQTLETQRNALLEEKRSLLEAVDDDTKRLRSIRSALESFNTDPAETNNNVKLYSQLQELILMEESLKNQEQEFREQCHTDHENLQTLLREASERNQDDTEDADAVCETERLRVANLRLQIASKNRAIAQLQRTLDEVPGRAELAQYQHRFLELYNLVAQKHAETKQFYTMYNTLDDTRLYMAKELSLLNSILDTYAEALSSEHNKAAFIKQFENIVSAIKNNKANVESRRNEEKYKRDILNQQLVDMMEQQRNYVAVVRQLKVEVKRNEALLAQLRAS